MSMNYRMVLMLALALVLFAAGCGSRQAAPSPTPLPPPPTQAPNTAPNTATTQPTAAPISPVQTPVAPISPVQTPPVSPLATPAPTLPLPTPAGAKQATPRAVAADSNGATPSAAETAQVSLAARTFVAKQGGWALSQVQVKQVEPVVWSDSCLGVEQPGMMCAQVITPGYRMILSTPKGDVEVHTDQSGKVVHVVTT